MHKGNAPRGKIQFAEIQVKEIQITDLISSAFFCRGWLEVAASLGTGGCFRRNHRSSVALLDRRARSSDRER